MTSGVIYQIRNVESGKLYIGSARWYSSRRATHLRQLREGRHHSVLLQRAWEKHGPAAFVFEVVERSVSVTDLVAREQHWIDQLRAADPAHGYNVAPVAGSSLGVRRSPETRAKYAERMRRQHREQPMTPAMRAAISERMKGNRIHVGKPHPPETRAKIGSAQRGRKLSPEHVAKLCEARRRRGPVSEETRRKMSEAMMGNQHNLGKRLSAEHRRNIAEGVRRARAEQRT